MKEVISFYFSLYAGSASVRWSLVVSFSFFDDPDSYKIINSLNLSEFDNSLRTGIKKFIGLLNESPKSSIILKVLFNFSSNLSNSELDYTLFDKATPVTLEHLESLLMSKIFLIKERVAKEIFGELVFRKLTA